MQYQRRRRAGFTLVEMMVATALVMVIMLIISQAFASASKTFNTMRTAGYMQERLRGGINVLRKDLSSDHFGPPYTSGRGGPHVSDQRLDQPGWQPPARGYFELRQLPDPITGGSSVREPTLGPLTDGDGLTSTRAINHGMRFTVRLPDAPASELFAAKFSAFFTRNPLANAFINEQDILYTRWAQVAYFLTLSPDPTVNNTRSDGTGLGLYVLRRRVQLMPPQNVDIGPFPQAQAQQILLDCANYANDVITPYLIATPLPGFVIVRFSGPESLNDVTTVSSLRIPFQPHPTGDDIVMVDVLSMDIKAAWFNNPSLNLQSPPSPPPGGLPGSSPAATGMAVGNTDEPFDDLPFSVLQPGRGATRCFDTGYQYDLIDWDSPTPITAAGASGQYGFLTNQLGAPFGGINPVPLRINVRALQIKLRVWDPRAEQARQATVVTEV